MKKHERTAHLFNASGGLIVVSEVVDLEVHFGDVFLRKRFWLPRWVSM